MGDVDKLIKGDLGSEALDFIIAGVDPEDGSGIFCDRVFVIAGVSFIRSTDFDKFCAGEFHDVGEAEGAADFDKLAS